MRSEAGCLLNMYAINESSCLNLIFGKTRVESLIICDWSGVNMTFYAPEHENESDLIIVMNENFI